MRGSRISNSFSSNGETSLRQYFGMRQHQISSNGKPCMMRSRVTLLMPASPSVIPFECKMSINDRGGFTRSSFPALGRAFHRDHRLRREVLQQCDLTKLADPV